MMRTDYRWLSLPLFGALMMLVLFTSCDKDPVDPDPKPEGAFPKVALLEHFTSESCPNCPDGVKQIDAYMQKHPNTIWLSHHAGYKNDAWTILESFYVTQLLGVGGAPYVALDRQASRIPELGGSTYVLHPYYLDMVENQPAATTFASVEISPVLKDGVLSVHVAGQVLSDDNVLRLNVAVKENGLHGKQSDPNYTIAGSWDDYVHSSVIRTFVSSPLGDSVLIADHAYAADYTITLGETWNPDNCMLVAFLTDTMAINVIQAAETPLVAGTTGGADLPHGGVTPKAVPDGYPEGKYSLADFVKADTIALEEAHAFFNVVSPTVREWHINAWTTQLFYGAGSNKYIPFADIVFFTDATVDKLPASGELNFVLAHNPDEILTGTAWAGCCDLQQQRIYGSEVSVVNYDAFLTERLEKGANGRWLVAPDSKLSFSANGFALHGTSITGKPLHLVFSGTVQY